MKLFEQYGYSGFHTCVSTTFGIDFAAYEQLALARLRGAGCFNNLLVADANMLTYALDGASLPPQWAGQHYSVMGASAKGVFHPKLTLQLGREKGRLLIASANMTASGQAGNLELVGEVSSEAPDTGEAQLIAAAWRYLEGLLEACPEAGVTHQLRWLRSRTPWLFQASPADGAVVLSDGTRAAFLASDAKTGIGRRFADLVDDGPVRRLVVMSPYWDETLHAVSALAEQLDAEEIALLIDSRRTLFPSEAMDDLPDAMLYDLAGFKSGKNTDDTRFIHAKAILAQTDDADHLLIGSANVTWAALGDARSRGINEEACLYRQLEPDTVLAHLGLDSILDGAPLDPDGLPATVPDEPIPLAEVGRRSPGRFECIEGGLSWYPPKTGAFAGAIELLDADQVLLDMSLTPIGPEDASPRRYVMAHGDKRPFFARVRHDDGTLSALGIVTNLDVLRAAVRDKRSKLAESIALRLSEATEEGLWLLEELDRLEAASAHQRGHATRASRRGQGKRTSQANGASHEVLSYAQFIAGRQAYQPATGPAPSTLAGSDLSLIRGFLNRLLGMDEAVIDTRGAEDEAPDDFTLYGEEGEDATDENHNQGESAESTPSDITRTEAGRSHRNPGAEHERLAEVWATRQQVTQATKRFVDRTLRGCYHNAMSVNDILRLRAILFFLAAAGQPDKGVAQANGLQVLPRNRHEDGWPMLMGKVMYNFFRGDPPLVASVEVEPTEGAMPVDLLECWGTCLWAIHASGEALAAEKASPFSIRFLSDLAIRIYAVIGVSREEIESGPLRDTFKRTNERFAERLGVSSERIREQEAAAYARYQRQVLDNKTDEIIPP